MRARVLTAVLMLGLVPSPAIALVQQADGPFADADARGLYEAAAAARMRLDHELVSYTALVRQRVGAGLRMPLKDRTLYRAESAHRVFWSRDGEVLVQALALREQTPMGLARGKVHIGAFDDNFDPANDALMFGMVPPDDDVYERDQDDFWIAHPLEPRFLDGYRFTVGDTLVLSLPDGRRVRAIELQVLPVAADVHHLMGSLWIEPESGALVRAVYRLSDSFDAFRDLPDLKEEEDDDLKYVPGLFKPWTAEIDMIAVDYSLWGSGVWLPRSMHASGVATAGILKAPASMELTYDFESVVMEADLRAETDAPDDAAGVVRFATRTEALEALTRATVGDVPYRLSSRVRRRGPREREKRVTYLVPTDPSWLSESPDLPPPIWESAPGFTSEAELRDLFDGLAHLPTPPAQTMPRTFRWGMQRPDLLRYNRVEALSVGARGQIRPDTWMGPVSMTATVRLGVADVEPNVRLDATRETLRRRVTWSTYHELAAVDEDARHLGLGNSVTALLFGRDDGDYYRRSGTALEWTPPSADRRSFRVQAYGEFHRPARTHTDFALWHATDSAWSFRQDFTARRGWELGGAVTLAPWWGSDPRSAQGGVALTLRGAGGDWSFASAQGTGRAALPLPGALRLGLEAGGGTIWGDAPDQRLWSMGGATTLRGYAPRARVGSTFGRGRAELARPFSFGAVSVFGDAAWAGERSRIHFDDALASVGIGLSLVDGLIRMDGAWGLRGDRDFRLELYLDGLL